MAEEGGKKGRKEEFRIRGKERWKIKIKKDRKKVLVMNVLTYDIPVTVF